MFTFVHALLIGRFNDLINQEEQIFLILFFFWSIAWESSIVFDYNAAKFFTKSVFYEGSDKNLGFIKLKLSIINNGAILFNYLILETTYSGEQFGLKIITACSLIMLCISNWTRYEIKYNVSSKYTLKFNSNPSLK